MHLELTIIVRIPITEAQFPSYEATTLEEAAANQQKWLLDGSADLPEMLDYEGVIFSVKPIR